VRCVQLRRVGSTRVPVPVELHRRVGLPVDAELRPRGGAEREGVVVAVVVVPERRQPGHLEQRAGRVVDPVGHGPGVAPGPWLHPRPVEVVAHRPDEQEVLARSLLLGRVPLHGGRDSELAPAWRPRGAPVAEQEEVVRLPPSRHLDAQRVVSLVEERVAARPRRGGAVDVLQGRQASVWIHGGRRAAGRRGGGGGGAGCAGQGGAGGRRLGTPRGGDRSPAPARVHVVRAAVAVVRAAGVALAAVRPPL